MKKLVLCLALALCSAGAFPKSQTDTLVVSTFPVMHCENCENKIKKNVRFVKGTKEILTSVDEQKVTIIYDG
ncbi:MAG: heavy metal-associated domain-containing protein, partial [Candidatus Cryptobacteroides sp.]